MWVERSHPWFLFSKKEHLCFYFTHIRVVALIVIFAGEHTHLQLPLHHLTQHQSDEALACCFFLLFMAL